MRKHIHSAVLATLVTTVAIIFVPAASAKAQPCSLGCGATFSIAPTGQTHWESPQKFTKSENIAMGLTINGYQLHLSDGGACLSWAYGRGVMIAISTCGGKRSPIRLTAVRLRRGTTMVHVSYKLANSPASGS